MAFVGPADQKNFGKAVIMEKSDALLIIEYRVGEYLREFKRANDSWKAAKPGTYDPRERRTLDDAEIAMMNALRDYIFHPLGLECSYNLDSKNTLPTFFIGPLASAVPEIARSSGA